MRVHIAIGLVNRCENPAPAGFGTFRPPGLGDGRRTGRSLHQFVCVFVKSLSGMVTASPGGSQGPLSDGMDDILSLLPSAIQPPPRGTGCGPSYTHHPRGRTQCCDAMDFSRLPSLTESPPLTSRKRAGSKGSASSAAAAADSVAAASAQKAKTGALVKKGEEHYIPCKEAPLTCKLGHR